ncbi:MAG: hypothetical protein OXG78_08740 [Chloroflexi bacterium]|nr:hypothetical protein [Chloroflexota bacterium]
MKWLMLCLMAAGMIWVSPFTSAQDRGIATAIDWNPDGETIAIGSITGVWLFDNEFNELGHVEFKNVEQSKTDFVGSPLYLAWNATGNLLAVGLPEYSTECPIRIIDVNKLQVISEIELGSLAPAILWHPEDNMVLSGPAIGAIQIWDALTRKELSYIEFDELHARTTALCWLTEDTVAIARRWNAADYDIDIVDIAASRILSTFHHHSIGTSDCNRKRQLISITGYLVDLKTGEDAQVFNDAVFVPVENEYTDGYFRHVLAVSWSPDSRRFVMHQEGCQVHVFDAATGESLAKLSGGVFHDGAYSRFPDSIAWHPDGTRFAVVGQFGDIRVWSAETYHLLQRFDGFSMNDLGGWLMHASADVLHEAMRECDLQ